MGDANLNSNKWDEPGFGNKLISNNLRKVLDQNGYKLSPVGCTYFADHAQKNGNVAVSAIDHVYYNAGLEGILQARVLTTGSSDHLPVVAKIESKLTNDIYTRKIQKRSFKNFAPDIWKKCNLLKITVNKTTTTTTTTITLVP